MPFNRLRGFTRVALVLLALVVVAGCSENGPDDDEVFDDARKRVTDNVLPEMKDEAEAVLRNLTNLLAALPQICATPLAGLRTFESDLSALGRPDSVVLIGEDEEDSDDGF